RREASDARSQTHASLHPPTRAHTVGAMPATCMQHHPHEVELHSLATHTNPFLLDVRAQVEGPSGQSTVVPGFYDGNGTWRLRFCLTALGTWRYTTESEDSTLDGKRGEVECVPNDNPAVHGALGVDPLHPCHFVY